MAMEESVAFPLDTQLLTVEPTQSFSLALHGGAGGRIEELSTEVREEFEAGLRIAYAAGHTILAGGGSALDAVCSAVEQLEDNPLFNAGRGAALTIDGQAEHDAAVMDGTGRAGAIAKSRYAKNPVRVARGVMERSEHLLIVDPSEDLVTSWGLSTVPQEYFITDARKAQLVRVHREHQESRHLVAPRHGTVGAVARDSAGHIAAATSTGGMVGQHEGRVGDSPIIGAGTYARDGLAAISCTGDGEAFIRGVVAYDIAARMRYLGSSLGEAVDATIHNELTSKNASGGLVSVSSDGVLVIAHNSPTMFAAFELDGDLILHT
jgi:beta-aspartyl-peptidase (threonine type)